MALPRLFTNRPLVVAASLELDATAAHHAARVLRMQVGARVMLFNGDGCEYPAVISHIDKRRVVVEITERIAVDRESPLAIVLGLGISRGDRMDFAVQKATELGVSMIVPLTTEHSGVNLRGDRAGKKQLHWQQVAVSACEQSGRNLIPEIGAPTPLAQWIDTVDSERALVLDPTASKPLAALPTPRSIALLVGPEGGLSTAEVALASGGGFEALALGPRTLRTETAPAAAIAVCQFLWGDLGHL